MDVYTLPSLWEGMPYTVLEAMACRRPVVATDVVGTHEVLSGGAGILVPPGRPDLLGDTIVRLLQDQSLADHLGACARQRIEEIYLVEQQICRLEAVYERV
jgi:glycosyltransferase involved in cell wall biosynthesis